MTDIVFILGPTAVGKSSLAIQLAQEINGEIISADSMQIYKGLDIGTGKVTQAEMQGVKHHLIDIVAPDQSFSVEQYVTNAKQQIDLVKDRGKVPIVVGGTGLYVNALINGHNFAEAKPNEALRKKYTEISKTQGNQILYDMLIKCDSVSAQKISLNDTKRIIRAIEIYETTGCPKSEQVHKKVAPFTYKLFVLNTERAHLYNKINGRVDKMFADGLIEEVSKFLSLQDCQSMQAIGYKEVISFLNKEIDLTNAVDLVKRNSRRYAKRQLTYFRWFEADKIWLEENYLQSILQTIK